MSETQFTIDKPALEVRTERVFKASPQRLWQAVTDPAQIPQWWGPGKYQTLIETDDHTVGGKWRYIQTDPDDGSEHAFSGEYREIDEPNKLVRTFTYEPIPGHALVETLSLEDLGNGMTKFTTTARYADIEDLEGMVSMGMESGQRESLERLAALIETA